MGQMATRIVLLKITFDVYHLNLEQKMDLEKENVYLYHVIVHDKNITIKD